MESRARDTRTRVASDEDIAKVVAEHGWQAIAISDFETPFVYTCGLMTTFDHPELIVFDADSEVAYAILAAMIDDIRNGRSFADTGAFAGVLVNHNIGVRRVHPTQHELYLGCAMGHVRHMGRPGELEALQVFWPDTEGRFPYERDCDDDVYRAQPRLDVELTPSELEEFRAEWRDG